jgi:hypothetical protein
MIFTEFKDFDIKEVIRNRSDADWRALYIRRGVFITLNAVFIIGSAFLIYLVTVSSPDITKYLKIKFASWSWMPDSAGEYASLAPNIALSTLNSAIPPISAIFVDLE